MCWTNFFLMYEAWFHLSGYINSQHSRMWSAENPHALHENPLHPSKISVRSAQSWIWIMEILFFEGAVAVENYHNLLTQLITLLEENDGHCCTTKTQNIQTQNFSTLKTKPTKLSLYLSYLPIVLKKRRWIK